MGRRKSSFINKSTATTYNLIYRPTEEDAQQPERLLVDAGRGVGVGRPDATAAAGAAEAADEERRYPPGHPLAWLEQEAGSCSMSEERRCVLQRMLHYLKNSLLGHAWTHSCLRKLSSVAQVWQVCGVAVEPVFLPAFEERGAMLAALASQSEPV